MSGFRPLRIAVLGYYFADSFADNIADTLEHLGHIVGRVDTRSRLFIERRTGPRIAFVNHVLESSRMARSLLSGRRIASQLRGLDPQLVISTDGYLEPDDVRKWRATAPDSVWTLWFPDSLGNLARQQMLAAPYDRLFFKDPYLVDLLGRMTKLKVDYLPEACNPRVHRTERPTDSSEASRYEGDVAVVGNLYPYKGLILDALPSTLKIRFYGIKPRRPGRRFSELGKLPYVTGREKALAFGEAKIVLNTLHPTEIGSVNARLFEATACGGFVLTPRAPSLSALFTEHQEVATYDSFDELTTQIDHYLAAGSERTMIAEAGQRRSHSSHTYEHRLSTLLALAQASV